MQGAGCRVTGAAHLAHLDVMLDHLLSGLVAELGVVAVLCELHVVPQDLHGEELFLLRGLVLEVEGDEVPPQSLVELLVLRVQDQEHQVEP